MVLLFPRGLRKPQQIWIYRSFLTAVSPYFAAMFSADMAETRMVPAGEPLGDLAERVVEAGDMTDSDAESDAGDEQPDSDWRKAGVAADAHRIVVRDASYITYRAVISYCLSGHIAFARLRSRGLEKRAEAMRKDAEERAQVPARASPKQVFAVAEKLGLAGLKVRRRSACELIHQELALERYIAHVDSKNVVLEAFSNATAYPEMEEKLLNKLARQWTTVRCSPAIEVVEEVRWLVVVALTRSSKSASASDRGSTSSIGSSRNACAPTTPAFTECSAVCPYCTVQGRCEAATSTPLLPLPFPSPCAC